jgi:type VI protein secretion system component VasK
MEQRIGRIAALLMTLALVLTGALIALNWPALSVVAPVNVGAMQPEVSLGAAAAGWLAVLALLFFVAQASLALGSWRRSRRTNREIQRLRALAEAAETSRVEELRQLVVAEFRQLRERLDPPPITDLVVDEHIPGSAVPARSGFFAKRRGG